MASRSSVNISRSSIYNNDSKSQDFDSCSAQRIETRRALFGTDPNGLLTKAIIHQSFQNNYNSIFNFLNSTSKPTCVLIQQEELRNDSIGVLKRSIDQLTIDLQIKSIQITAPSNHSRNKKIHLHHKIPLTLL